MLIPVVPPPGEDRKDLRQMFVPLSAVETASRLSNGEWTITTYNRTYIADPDVMHKLMMAGRPRTTRARPRESRARPTNSVRTKLRVITASATEPEQAPAHH